MPPNNYIRQETCDQYRQSIFAQLENNSKEINQMKGAHRLAVVISPIIVSLILTLGGMAFASYVNSQLLTMKLEIKELIKKESK